MKSNTNWNPSSNAVTSYAEVDGAHRYIGVDSFGIEPGTPLDLSGKDTIHISVMRTDEDADLLLTLVDFGGRRCRRPVDE